VGVVSQRRCPCGRALPLLERVEGRSNDIIVAPDGRMINSLALIYTLREIDGIEQFRIRQTAVDRFHVELVPNARFSPAGEDRIRRAWAQLLRSPLTVTFVHLRELSRDASGKFRHVVSEIRGSASLAGGR
jgi:phenylacetate-CoA ligase